MDGLNLKVFLTAFEKYINSCVSPLIQFKVEKAKLTFFNFCNSSSIFLIIFLPVTLLIDHHLLQRLQVYYLCLTISQK